MSNCKEKVKDRILAAILVIVMLTSIIPITVFASTPKNPGVFTFTVVNTTGDEIDEATIDYDIQVNGVSAKTGLVATADGEAVISDMADYADTISAGVDTVSIDYTVSKSGYTDEIGTETVSDDTGNISVVLAEVPVPPEQVTVTVNSTENGVVKLNGAKTNSVTVDKGSSVSVEITPKEGYQIASVSIGGTAQTFSPTGFSKTIEVESDTEIKVSFVEVYTFTVTVDGNGNVVTTPAIGLGGSVIVEEGDSISITATPNENYRVSRVVKNGKETNYTTNDFKYVDSVDSVDQSYIYEITFALNQYNITVKPYNHDHGTVEIGSAKVDYDGNTSVIFTPADGYDVDNVQVNGVDATLIKENDDTVKIELSNVREDKEIEVTFTAKASIDMTDVSFNEDDAVRTNYAGTADILVFAKGSTVTFTTTRNGIRINGQGTGLSFKTKTWSTTSTVTINKIELYYKAAGDKNAKWHQVDLAKSIRIVIDNTLPGATLTPSAANTNGYYNNNVNIGISVKDPDEYSGIKTVEYWVTKDGSVTQGKGSADVGNGMLYDYSVIGNPVLNTHSNAIVVDASKNNSDNVVVHVKVTDRAGNECTTRQNLKINTTLPTVSVNIGGTLHNEATEGYYNTQRTATITIVDRATTFDETSAYNGIEIQARDAQNNPVVISKATMISAWTHSGDTHTAKILFNTDANYTWNISYTNKADVSNDGVTASGNSIYTFAIDTTAPTGSVSIEANTWSSLLSTLTFGLWKNYYVTANGSSNDTTSPVYDIKYYKSNSDTALTEADLVALYADGKFVTDVYTVSADEQFAVYARVTDYAGNTLYIGSNGVIVDMTDGVITLTPDVVNENGFYNSDVNVNIDVDEEAVSGVAYSGIKSIDYWIVKDNDNANPTQGDNLYTFNIANPTKAQLKKDWSGSIVVEKSLNNSDNVKVIVTVKDNAGNEYDEEIALAINTDKPTIAVSFDNNKANKTVEGRGYFGASRTATVTIVDRASAFNAEKATAGIVINRAAMISGWSHDGNTHTATVTFAEDGNYTWSLSYTNDADNENTEVTTGESVTPFNFTVDKTKPSGEISIDSNEWDTLLEVLTFGLYKSSSVDVTAKAEDATSPVTIEYYKVVYDDTADADLDDITIMGIDALDKEYEKGSFVEFEAFSVPSNEKFVVYLRITDYAGNYSYISSDGYVVDNVASSIELNPEEANINGFYKGDVDVEIKIEDAPPYSGIKSVEYWVQKDSIETQREKIFAFDVENPAHKDLVNEWNGTITVDSEINNSSNVVVYVKTIDNAGNEETQSVKLDIDITAPTIDITFDNNADNNGNTYFNAARTATVVITERTHHFDAKAATEGIVIKAVDSKGIVIKAVDSKGKEFEFDTSSMISTWETTEGDTPDEAKHEATITFDTDANYTFDISYTDMAGNENDGVDTKDSVAPYKFTVDTTAPTGTVTAVSAEGRKEEWSKLRENLQFGFWSNAKITISGTSDDLTSPIDSVVYYKTNLATALTKDDLNAISEAEWTKFETFEIIDNEQFTVYIKITDMAGNYTYISTNGLILDNISPRLDNFAPMVTIDPQQPINDIYNGDVRVDITVDDPINGGTYSGLNVITYRVLNMGVETQSGTLYSFADEISNESPTRDELLKTWTGKIIVESEKNNSNDVVIEVYAEDNALNSTEEKELIKIDITEPTIYISYDNNASDSGNYYKANRTATIVVTERNFHPEDVKITITNTDGAIPAISSWTMVEGEGNQDGTTHTTKIVYSADGDYVFSIEYTDTAGNICSGEVYDEETTNPKVFTIDQIDPKVTVTYDNNEVLNEKYYKAERIATITIHEHNFSSERVTVSGTATDDGAVATFPKTSEWTTNGDVHTATIHYAGDAKYIFSVSFIDLSGRSATNYTPEEFFIDKTNPLLENEKDNGFADVYRKPVNEQSSKVFNYNDINFNEIKHVSKAYNYNIIDKDKQIYEMISTDSDPAVISGTSVLLSLDHFKKDGVYEIKSTAFDLAGNDSGEKVYTHVVMRNTAMMAYIPENSLKVFNNIGTRSIDFEDIPINVYTTKDDQFTVKIGEMVLDSSDYVYELEQEIATQVKEHRIFIPQRYIVNTFNEDAQVYDLPINILNDGGQIITIGRMVVDNVKPFGEFEEGFKNGKGYYGVTEKQVSIVKLSDDIDEKTTEIYVNGEKVNFDYDPAASKITFTLSKSAAYGHPWNGYDIKVKLVDTAGNEYSLTEISNIYVGNLFLRTWIFFALGGIALVGAAVFVFKSRGKRED